MLTNGMEKREFLYADDCSEGLFLMMNKFNFFVKREVELHLTTSKKTRIIDIAKIIKHILKNKKILIKIFPSKNKDNLQKNVNNLSNNFFLKFWKPKFTVKSGIEKIIEYHLRKNN
jgi:nucleoside-diphosphate-sugar epimerase